MQILKAGTRGSTLSLVQTNYFIDLLGKVHPDIEIKKIIIATKGDQDRTTPLYFLSQKSIFEKELNDEVLNGGIDFAVHSLKDLPVTELNPDLAIAAIPIRESPYDVLVSQRNKTIQELSPGNTVGTSSLLRAAQIKRLRPDLVPKPIRGNVETRIGKVESGEYNAAILAEAGLKRLGLEHKIAQILPSEQFMPAPGQGIIAGVTRRDNKHGIELLRSIDDDASRVEGETERQVAQILEAGCKVPVGVLARVRLTSVSIHACVFSLEGTEKLESNRVGPVDQALSLATEVGNDLLAKGAKKLEEGWRTVYA